MVKNCLNCNKEIFLQAQIQSIKLTRLSWDFHRLALTSQVLSLDNKFYNNIRKTFKFFFQ